MTARHFDPPQSGNVGRIKQQVFVGIQVLQRVSGKLLQFRAEIRPRRRRGFGDLGVVPPRQRVHKLVVLGQSRAGVHRQHRAVPQAQKLGRVR